MIIILKSTLLIKGLIQNHFDTMLFTEELVHDVILQTTNTNYKPNVAFIPSHHGGEIGGSLEKKVISILALSHADTFGEVGCGRGKFILHMKLLHQHNTCFGVECVTSRLTEGHYWWSKIYATLLSDVPCTSHHVNSRRNPQAPIFINGNFTEESFWSTHGETYFSRRNLKLFINNYGEHMLHDGTQTKLEMKLDQYCASGTFVVALSKMFMDREAWDIWVQKQVITHKIKAEDVSWTRGRAGGIIKLYVYVKY
jgi:hypothetical protein